MLKEIWEAALQAGLYNDLLSIDFEEGASQGNNAAARHGDVQSSCQGTLGRSWG